MSCAVAMDEEQNIKTKLTATEVQRYKTLLLAKREEILGNVRAMLHQSLQREIGDLSNVPTDMTDAGMDNFEIENILGLMDSERKLLGQINEALQRIEDGRYGICEGCGELIPRNRLEAIPWAKFCVTCANLLEKGTMKQEVVFNKYDYIPGIDDEEDVEPDNFRIDN